MHPIISKDNQKLPKTAKDSQSKVSVSWCSYILGKWSTQDIVIFGSISMCFHHQSSSTFFWCHIVLGKPCRANPWYLWKGVEQTPDIYGRELQYALFVTYNVDVDVSTIIRTLHRHGFTRKKVGFYLVLSIVNENKINCCLKFDLHVSTMRSLGSDIEQILARITPQRHWFLLMKLLAITWQLIDSKHGCILENRHVGMTTSFRVKDTPFCQLLASIESYTSTFLHAHGQLKHLDHSSMYSSTKWTHISRETPSWCLIMQVHTTLKISKKWLRGGKFLQCCDCHSNDKTCNSGQHLRYLPAYSPYFNPIEQGFSGMKAWICGNRDYVLGELSGELTCDPYEMLWSAVFELMTPDRIVGWYKDSGYVA